MLEIVQLTTNIETNYPELYSYLGETPLTVGETKEKTVSTDDLKQYLETLKAQLRHHIETHRSKKNEIGPCMRIRCIIILFHFLFFSLGAQTPWYDNYPSSEKILNRLKTDTTYFTAAENLSWIGEYQKALEIWDKKEQKPPARLTSTQAKHFSRFKPTNAKKFIIEKAKTEQIIIINEAHQQPYHRVFTRSILHDLYQQGFRYFGVETISNFESSLAELSKNKFPTLTTGFYTREPFYGDLVRQAINEGFEVFAYETTSLKPAIGGEREIEQAKNIKKILDKDPKAKILIHCGWDHIVETQYFSWGKAMAGRLKELTNIDPYTIDQTRLSEHATPDYENPYYKVFNLEYDAIFSDTSKNAFSGPPEKIEYDARVYHPRTKWVSGRPNWVFENGRVPYFIEEKITVSFPCLVFAFIPKENNASKEAIPYDIIELKNKKDKKALSLKKDEQYIIVLRDEDGKQQDFTIIAK